MDVQFKRPVDTVEESRSCMKLAVTTESKDRLKYYLDLLDYHHISYKAKELKIMGDTFSEVYVLPHHYKAARSMWGQTVKAVQDETQLFTD